MPSANLAEDQIIALEKRVRDLEQAVKLMSQELRHAREMDEVKHDTLLLKMQNAVQSAGIALPDEMLRSRKKS